MDTLLQDLGFALRGFRKVPGFAAVAVITLALGIGANTTIFSIVSALFIDAVPFDDTDRLVNIDHVSPRGWVGVPVSYDDFEAWRRELDGFESLAARVRHGYTLAHDGSDRSGALKASGYRVTPGFFNTLGVLPLLGRGFLPGEAEPGRDGVVVLSQHVWEQRFGADPAIVGRTVIVDGAPRAVVGVLRSPHRFPADADLWVPLLPTDSERTYRFLGVIGRLRPGVTPERASAALATLQDGLELDRPEDRRVASTRVVPLAEQQTEHQGSLLRILLVAVGFVLLIACANVAALLLARATSRRQEIAVRASLGAGRTRIVRQLLTESLVLALLAGALGVLLGVWGVELLRDAVPAWLADNVLGWDRLGVDPRTLGYTLALSVATGIVFGLAPALHSARADFAGVLRDGSRGSTGRHTARAQRALVAAEVALAVVLLSGAGLLVRSFVGLIGAATGFDSDGVLAVELALPPARYDEGAKSVAFQDRVIEGVRGMPGVREVGIVSNLPMSRTGWRRAYRVEGDGEGEGGGGGAADWRPVSAGYFGALRIPVLRGRGFTDADGAGAPRVVIVSRELVRRHFPEGEALGRRLVIGEEGWEIVGVVDDVAHVGPRNAMVPMIYAPHAQWPTTEAFLVVRADGDPAALAGAVRREIGALEPAAAVARVNTMDGVVADFLTPDRLMTAMLAIFAAMAMLIAAIGLYGVVAYAVERRRFEFGIRMALGARAGDIVRLVARWGLVPVAAGTGMGLLGALAVTRALSAMLYGVGPADPAVLAGTAALLLATAAAAGVVPIRRALAVDPASTLREE